MYTHAVRSLFFKPKYFIILMTLFKRLICGIILFAFCVSLSIPPPVYGQISYSSSDILSLTPSFHPVMIQGLRYHPENPLQIDFIVDVGDTALDVQGSVFKSESISLIKYFMTSMTVPEKEMWVNLSPYEKDRIIPNGLGQTDMGKDMLSQDYILKQITSSLLYPDSKTGKIFWEKVYARIRKKLGATDVPIDTFNKVWIVPDKAVVYERGSTVYIAESHLKVMLEEDYAAMVNGVKYKKSPGTQAIAQEAIREIVLPVLEEEVNSGKNFSKLRQIYNAMILAVWFKCNLQKSILGQVYVDKNKTAGVDAVDKSFRKMIYEQYLMSFKKGVYNYIREENDPIAGKMQARKYFSGGLVGVSASLIKVERGAAVPQSVLDRLTGRRVEVDAAMTEVSLGSSRNLDLIRIKESIAQKLQEPLDAPIVEKLAHVEVVREEFLRAEEDKVHGVLAAMHQRGPPKIAEIHFTSPPHWSGVDIVLAEEVKWLTAQGFPVKIISGTPFNDTTVINPKHVHISQLNDLIKTDPIFLSSGDPNTSLAFNTLEQKIYDSITPELVDMDIIIIQNVLTVRNNLPFTAALRRIIRENPQKQFIVYIHNAEDLYHEQYPLSLLNPTLDLPNVRYATVSNYYRHELSQAYGVPESRFFILNPGVQVYSPMDMTTQAVADFRRHGLLGKERVITMAFPTRMGWNKDIGKVFLLLNALQEKIAHGVKLVIAAPGIDSFDALTAEVRDKISPAAADFLLSIRASERNIIFLDTALVKDYRQHRQYILDIMALSDFLLYTTTMETFGMFVLEAATTGTDIIATNVPPHQESLGQDGLLFDNKEPLAKTIESITERIAAYSSNQISRDALQRRMLERYQWDKLMESQLTPLLLEMLDSRPLLSNAVKALNSQSINKAYTMMLDTLDMAAKFPDQAGQYLDDISGALRIISEYQSADIAGSRSVADALRLSLEEFTHGKGYKDGIAAFQTIVLLVQDIKRDPRNVNARIALALILADNDFQDSAAALYDEVLSIDKQNTQSRIEIARILAGKGAIQQAILRYREVLQIDPMNQDADDGLKYLDQHPSNMTRSQHPDIERTIREGDYVNRVVRYVRDRVSAHIVVNDHPKKEQEIIIAIPNRDTENAFYLKAVSKQGDFKWRIGNTSAIITQDGYRGIEFRSNADRTQVNFDFNVSTNLMVTDVVDLRMFRFYHSNIPEQERQLMAHLQQMPQSQQRELEQLIGVPLAEIIIPKVSVIPREDGTHVIAVTKTTFDGQHHYRLDIEVPSDFNVENRGGSITINGTRPIGLLVRATTDFEPLTPLPIEEILNREALAQMQVDPQFRKIAENFALLFYQEKLLAGSWHYLAFFGRDTLVGARLMWTALSTKAKLIIIRSVLDRIGGGNMEVDLDGLVAVTDEVTLERYFQTNVTQRFYDYVWSSPDVLGMFKDALQNTKRGILKYGVLDNTFLMPGIEKLLVNELSAHELSEFFSSNNARSETNIETILKNWNSILILTDPYTQGFNALRERHPDLAAAQLYGLDEFHALSERLVRKLRGATDVNWRDSYYALGWGEYAADNNVSLAPIALGDIGFMVKKLESAGIDVRALANKHGLHMLQGYMEDNGAGLTQAQDAWVTSIEHFRTHFDKEQVRAKVREYLNSAYLSPAKREVITRINISQEDNVIVTVGDFLNGEIPAWLDKGVSYTNVALGQNIMHSDETYSLLDKDLDTVELNRILDTLFSPYPLGLWNDDVGLFIANVIYSDNDDIKREFNKEGAYHGQNVVWSKTTGELKMGLIRQIRNAKRSGRGNDVDRLMGFLAKVIKTEKKIGDLGLSEVWTWQPGLDGHMTAAVFSQGPDGQPPGNPQLWGISDAMRQQEYKEALARIAQKNEAMLTKSVVDRPGGIDLDPAMLRMEIKGDHDQLIPAPSRSSTKQVSGFTPLIMRILPMDDSLFSI